MRCVWCGVRRSYYESEEHASRQSCLASDSGYHYFSDFAMLIRAWECLRGSQRSTQRESLLQHRRQKRPHTI